MHCDTPRTEEVSHGSPAPSIADALRLWRHVNGDRGDLLQVFTGYRKTHDKKCKLDMVSERYYTSDKLEQAIAWAAQQSSINRDVYFCTHQLLAPQRIKDNAAAVLTLWCETDGVDVASSPIKPTALVESSPGHFHCYARLNRPIAPLLAEKMNKRWAKSFGADGSGFDLTQLLRVPGTRNYGYPETPEVKLVYIDVQVAYDPDDLDELLPKLPSSETAICGSRAPVPVAALSDDDNELIGTLGRVSPVAGRLYAGDVSDCADTHGKVDPSDADWRLIRELLRATGLDADRTERLARQSSLYRPKWDERRGDKNCLRYEIDRALDRWSQDERDPATWPRLTVAPGEPGPLNGKCSDHCGRHLERIRELEDELAAVKRAERIIAEVQRNPRLKPTVKAVAVAIARDVASQQSRGVRGSYAIVCSSPLDPDRPGSGDGLAQRLGISGDTVSSALKILAGPGGPISRNLSRTVGDEGQYYTRVMVEPADEEADVDPLGMLQAVATLEPERPATPVSQLRPLDQRCRRHPMADINKVVTYSCVVCTRTNKKEERRLHPYFAVSELGGSHVGTTAPQTADLGHWHTCSECRRKLSPEEQPTGVCQNCAQALVGVA